MLDGSEKLISVMRIELERSTAVEERSGNKMSSMSKMTVSFWPPPENHVVTLPPPSKKKFLRPLQDD